MFNTIIISLLFLNIPSISASVGDRVPIFRLCIDSCLTKECLDDDSFVDDGKKFWHLTLLRWGCVDECKHACMWEVVDEFKLRNYPIPQFFGKWPFIRFLGIQEPASVFFSLLNFYVHFSCIRYFRKKVQHDSPMYWVWHAYCAVCLNAWIWSTVFHTRDIPWTEFLDYLFAFSIILMNCYCMFLRVLRDVLSRFMNIVITTVFVVFFLNHAMYLSRTIFDYGYNMAMNIIVGSFTVLAWFAWCLYNRHRMPYVWKASLFFALFSLSTLLEIIDLPPIWYIFDSHALWHFTSAPITYLLYSFMIDDCEHLRKQMQYIDMKNIAKEA